MKLLFLLLLSINISYAKELKKVTLQLSWFDQFQFAGYYMAKEKGYYEEFGLDVTILPFKYGLN
ncbi:MAG: ABC transporter substrate-binding protein, partial [Campylobacteraceae bacterium]|nr:ABC transporter substrate-binding protein [Campylobacteraceae bacterium]